MHGHNGEDFGGLPLSELCIPGLHNAGNLYLDFDTTCVTGNNVLTQTQSIFEQLELNVEIHFETLISRLLKFTPRLRIKMGRRELFGTAENMFTKLKTRLKFKAQAVS